jgi:hypothetical protein
MCFVLDGSLTVRLVAIILLAAVPLLMTIASTVDDVKV